MIRVVLPSLLVFCSVAAMAARPRFLGPPVKKPADAGPSEADAGTAEHGQADPPVLNPGDDAPMFAGVLHNADSAGVNRVDLSSMVGSEGMRPPYWWKWCSLTQSESKPSSSARASCLSVAFKNSASVSPNSCRYVGIAYAPKCIFIRPGR